MWDVRFSEEEYVYGKEPNTFFKEQLLKKQAGKLLLPGEGEGRNAVFAALKGWEVTAFDSSKVGKEKAERLAVEQGVEISYHLASYESSSFEENSFDIIALVYTHTNNREALHKKMLNYLKPGGILIIEGFSKEQIEYNTGGPGRIDMLYSTEEIDTDFIELTEKTCGVEEVILDEGPYHSGKASVLRFVGKK